MGIRDERNGTDGETGRRAERRGGPGRTFLLLPALALLLAGCAGNGVGGGDGNEGPMGSGNSGGQGLFGSTMQTTTVARTPSGGNTSGAGTAAVTPGDADASEFTCPPVQVRGGAAAWQVTDPQDGAVRYQATLGQFSRECRFTAPDMTMRVGIQGRVLLGAKGGPGKVNVPIRVAIVEEGPTPKSVWTQFYSVPVEIGPGVLQVDFSLVADPSFPRPTPALSERYVVYVGFDPQGANEKPQRQRPPAQARPRTQSQPQAQQQPRQPTRQTQTAPAAAPVQTTAPAVQAAPAAPVRTVAPAPASNDGDTQWIGAPAPSTGTFSQ